jgi:hypothetical protein
MGLIIPSLQDGNYFVHISWGFPTPLCGRLPQAIDIRVPLELFLKELLMKPKKHLSFSSLRESLSECFNKIKDHRQVNKVKHSIHDALMCGFACMHFQDPSLLQFQKRLEKTHHSNNLKTMFAVTSIPEATQLREIVDEVSPETYRPFFKDYFHQLQRGKYLEQFQIFPGLYYAPMDGTQYFCSDSISCDKCLTTAKRESEKEKDDGDESEDGSAVNFSHKMVQIAIMHPDMKQVIPLMPEEISNTDGTTKQDCEMNAAKRLIPQTRKDHPQLGLIFGGDDLFSRQPIIKDVLSVNAHYIFVAKPTSHKYLHEWLDAYPSLHSKNITDADGTQHVYQWMNGVPLHGGADAITTNYFSYQMIKTDEKGKEKITYRNSWVTDLEVTDQNIITMVKAGRCKWKIENECFNTLKNQGYCIEHSFGHGEKNLCINFYLLTLAAFAFHQVFELTDKLYKECRLHFGSKKHLWENIRAVLRIFIFDTWEFLLAFTLNPENYNPDRPMRSLA